MKKEVEFFEDRPSAARTMAWYDDVTRALECDEASVLNSLGSSAPPPIHSKFAGFTRANVNAYFKKTRAELELLVSLALLASAEAVLRRDFLTRIYEQRKDPVSQAFKQIYDAQEKNPVWQTSLERDILGTWKDHHPQNPEAFRNFKSMLKLRHWLAHGRWSKPNLGREPGQYTARLVFDTASALFTILPQVTGWPGNP